MATSLTDNRVKLLVTIVDRGRGGKAVDLYRAQNLHFDFICLGLGTASSRILNYFGLAETEKDVVLTLAPADRLPGILRRAKDVLSLERPGKGILFTVPLSGLSSQITAVLNKPEYRMEENIMSEAPIPKEESPAYELVLTILNRGFTDTVMDAAREAGARGGTIVNARRVGFEDAQNLLGFSIQPEKEIIVILIPKAEKKPVMQAINKVAGLTTECRGIVISLPVDDILGLNTQKI